MGWLVQIKESCLIITHKQMGFGRVKIERLLTELANISQPNIHRFISFISESQTLLLIYSTIAILLTKVITNKIHLTQKYLKDVFLPHYHWEREITRKQMKTSLKLKKNSNGTTATAILTHYLCPLNPRTRFGWKIKKDRHGRRKIFLQMASSICCSV